MAEDCAIPDLPEPVRGNTVVMTIGIGGAKKVRQGAEVETMSRFFLPSVAKEPCSSQLLVLLMNALLFCLTKSKQHQDHEPKH